MKDRFYKYSIYGILLGLLGFLFDSLWICYPLFIVGTFICGTGWMIGMEKAGQETVKEHREKTEEKREKKRNS